MQVNQHRIKCGAVLKAQWSDRNSIVCLICSLSKCTLKCPEAQNIQTFMIVWDIHTAITKKLDKIVLYSPLFSLNRNTSSDTKNWQCVSRYGDEIKSGCTTYMLNPLKRTLMDVYEGFDEFTYTHSEWSTRMRFVFEMRMQCDSSAVRPTIWRHCTTETMPLIHKYPLNLNLDVKEATHSITSNRGLSCEVSRYLDGCRYAVTIVRKLESTCSNGN